MSDLRLTEEQQDAIRAEMDSFTVRASAGSGKTTVLVQRYLRHIVELGHRPDEILTITFTRKAAAEMKGRIVSELRALKLYDDAQIAETGPIQTIHSLCERLLRENSLAAGIDPRFEVMPEATVAALVEEAVRWCLDSELHELPYAERLVSDLAGEQAYNATHAVHAKLGLEIRNLLREMRGSGHLPDELRERYSDPARVIEAWMAAVLRELPDSIAESVRDLPADEVAARITELIKQAGLRKPAWVARGLLAYDETAARHTCGLMQLATLAWDWLESRMIDRQEFDFSMLESRAVALVQTVPETAERLRGQYRAMLVDEAQDVNPVQYRLLSSLGVGSEMLVGDPQQSIYGFRLADRGLFIERTANSASLKLTANHRSEPGILRFVDALFGRLWPDDYQPMLQSESSADDPFGDSAPASYEGVEFWPQDAKDTFATAAAIEQLIEGGEPAGSIAVLTRSNWTAHEVAERLTARGVATRVLGGSERFYTRLEVRDIANALDTLADPSKNFHMLALLRSPFVGLSVDSVVLLSQQSPVIDALEGFEPPVEADRARIEEFLRWFVPLAEFADRVPAWEVLSELLRLTPYLPRIAERPGSEQTLANVRKLFFLATQDPMLGAQAYAEKIRQVQELRHREGDAPSVDEDADAVTLMTIHRAKGLEFDVVVLPDTHRRLKPRTPDLMVDARSGLVMARFTRLHTMASRWMSEQIASRAVEEELRVLYVAMTRARRRLCVVVSPSPDEVSAAGIVCGRMNFAEGAPSGVYVRKPFDGP
ncbi:MAG: UvrD-helicase domain-containing protein [Armatimonadetes bacterium]|nr:UvrD-helicase domain-containing protein [Armatimonadota bacterium]